MAEREEVVAAILAAAREAESAEEFEEGELRGEATEVFGSWEAALVASLVEAVSGGRKARRPAPSEVERRVTEAFEHPIYLRTGDGKLFALHGPDLSVSMEGQDLDEEDLVGKVRETYYIGDSDAVFLFSNKGRIFGVDQRLIPVWDRRDQPRSLRDNLFLESGEYIGAIVPRRALALGRVIHVTADAKGKATDCSEFGTGLDRSGREAFLVRDEDELVTVLVGPTKTTVFCASALGQGIHFEAEELRSMGRKAVGVNLMKLAGDDDKVVAAFLGQHVRQIAVITEQGMGKRVDFSEFRTQGRAGQGMQLARLNGGDRIAGVVPCNPAEDLAITTSTGRLFRIPTSELLMMGRPAKGNQVLELESGERVIHLEALPCGKSPG